MLANTFIRSTILCLLALLSVSALRAEELRWKFKPGEPLLYVLQRNAEGKITLKGAEIAFTLEMIFDTTWKANSVADDGTANLELTVDRIQIDMKSPLFGNLVYDSRTGDEPQGPVWAYLKPVMNGMLGQTFHARVSPLGQVSDIELPEKLADALAKQNLGENRRQGFGIGNNDFNEKGIKDMLIESVLPLPETSEADVTWTQSFENEIPMVGTQLIETTFSLDGTETQDGQELAKIAAVTELFFEPLENPRADLEIMEQEAASAYYFDPQAGHLVTASGTRQNRIELSGPEELVQEMKETMTMRLGKSPDEPAAKAQDTDEKGAPDEKATPTQ